MRTESSGMVFSTVIPVFVVNSELCTGLCTGHCTLLGAFAGVRHPQSRYFPALVK